MATPVPPICCGVQIPVVVFLSVFCKQSEAAKITSKTDSENLQDSFQSAGCPRAAGRLLPEPGGLVLS